MAKSPALELCDEYQDLYDKATFAKETTKNKGKATVTKIRDVSVLLKLAVIGCQVLVEQGSLGTDNG